MEEPKKIDTIVLATGYEANPDFPSLNFCGISKLYKNVFNPQFGSGIGYIGLSRPSIGAITPIMELQARWFSMLCAQNIQLPSDEFMISSIEKALKQKQKEYRVCYERLPAVVSYIRYMDQIAEEIDCRPNPSWLIQNPLLFWKIITGPFVPFIYRLSSHDPLYKQEQAIKIISQLPRTWPLSYLSLNVFWSIVVTIPSLFGFSVLANQNSVI